MTAPAVDFSPSINTTEAATQGATLIQLALIWAQRCTPPLVLFSGRRPGWMKAAASQGPGLESSHLHKSLLNEDVKYDFLQQTRRTHPAHSPPRAEAGNTIRLPTDARARCDFTLIVFSDKKD